MCCNLILFNQNCWKIVPFFISYFLILKCQDLLLKVIYSWSNVKRFSQLLQKKLFKGLKFLDDDDDDDDDDDVDELILWYG